MDSLSLSLPFFGCEHKENTHSTKRLNNKDNLRFSLLVLGHSFFIGLVVSRELGEPAESGVNVNLTSNSIAPLLRESFRANKQQAKHNSTWPLARESKQTIESWRKSRSRSRSRLGFREPNRDLNLKAQLFKNP